MKPLLMATRRTFIWGQRQSTRDSKSSSILIPNISLYYSRWRWQRNSTKRNKFKNGKQEKGIAARLNLWSQHTTLSTILTGARVKIHMPLLLRVLSSSRSKIVIRYLSRSLRIRLKRFLSQESSRIIGLLLNRRTTQDLRSTSGPGFQRLMPSLAKHPIAMA